MRIPTPVATGLVLFAALLAAGAHAQQMYRIVGPDGKVTYSDRAPANQQADVVRNTRGIASQPGGAALPAELRDVVAKFPVTLYTGNDCAPCASVRSLLVMRGVPFTERTVTTNQDIDAFRKLSGNSEVPFGTIGGQHLSGYSQQEWSEYLNLAGYPKQSRLPINYKQPEATPLVPLKTAEEKSAGSNASGSPAADSQAPARRPRPEQAPAQNGTVTPQNPAGIRF